jgi:MoaD family protein
MAIRVSIPSPLREHTGGQAEVAVAGATVKEALGDLVGKFPTLKQRLFLESGEVRHHINVFVNSEDVRYLDELATAVKDGDLIDLIPAVAGG